MDKHLGKRIISLRQAIVANFNAGNWEEVGLMTGQSEAIATYPRLLRSLSWGDEDYAGNVLGVLRQIAEEDVMPFARSNNMSTTNFRETPNTSPQSLRNGASRLRPASSVSLTCLRKQILRS
jgi:hypothetical protein